MNSDNQITSELKDLILSQVKGKTEIPGS
ncbi:MAG: hypothetical protein QOG00_1282, partial [Pyrinomonadaceae bacterium]|nr:hypothetical protein [Pyrinomonadaceae bacterium]